MRALLICGLILSAPLGALPMQGPRENNHPLPEGPKIKVLLESELKSALLEVRGGYRVLRRDTGTILSSGTVGKRFVVHALQDGLRWGEEYPDVYQISILPTHPDTVMLVDGIQYKGAISVYHVQNNQITVVNEVPIEDYLKATLALRFNAPLHKEAMSALVIAARTEAYARSLQGRPNSRPWQITADEANYFGCGVTHQRNKVDEAVDRTRYMILDSYNQGIQKINLDSSKVEELANLGLNAKKILQSTFPNHSLGLTINSDEIALK